MLKIVKNIITFLFVFSIGVSIGAEPLTVTTSVDKTRLAVGQQILFTVELSGEAAQKVGNPELPSMNGYLNYLGSRGTSQNISFVNGKMSVSKSFNYYYMAAKEGTFTIPPVKVSHKGKTYSSEPIQITIIKSDSADQQSGSQQSQQQLSDEESKEITDELMLRAIVDKKKVYQNQPVIVTYRIYARVNVSSYGISKLPELTGFWAEDFQMPSNPTTRQQIINGKRYTIADIKKQALFPTSPGEKTIGSMVLECDVRVRRNTNRDIFDSFFDDPFFGRSVRRNISSKPVKIDVIPFPSENKPADFSGAVGNYTFDVSVDKKEVETNEAVTLKVRISGTGNIKLLPQPNVQIPPDFEQYAPEVAQNIQRSGNTISGQKTFEYVLVPRFPGKQRIAPVTFSYFDPKTKQYYTLKSEEIIIAVRKSADQFIASSGSGLSKREVELLGKDIRFIKLSSDNFQRIGSRFYSSFLFYALAIGPLFLLGVAFAYKSHIDKLHQNEAYARSRRANAIAMKRLGKAKAVLDVNSQKEFYAEIADALYGFVADKLNKEKAGLIRTEVESEFEHHSIDPDVRNEYFDLLNRCDFMRFAPSDVTFEDMKDFYQRAKQVIIKLEKAL